MNKAANHESWRTLFQEATGHAPHGEEDANAFNNNPPITSISILCAGAKGKGQGQGTLPSAIRAFIGPPPKLVLRFRQLLEWCDRVFTYWYLRFSRAL